MPPPVTSRCGTGCAATSIAAVTIDPEGLLYKCPDDAGQPGRAYGSVFSESVANPGNLLHWLSYDWFNHAECRECTMLPQCAGAAPISVSSSLASRTAVTAIGICAATWKREFGPRAKI